MVTPLAGIVTTLAGPMLIDCATDIGGGAGVRGTIGGTAKGARGLLLLLPRLGHAVATGTPTPMALDGGGPAGGAGVGSRGAGTRTGFGAGIELRLVRLEERSKPPPEIARVASWKL